MKEKLGKEERVNILYILKRIFIDNDEVTTEIPGLDKIVPQSIEEKKLLEDLKQDVMAREKRNAFRKELVESSSKLKKVVKKDTQIETENKKVKRKNKSKDDEEIQL